MPNRFILLYGLICFTALATDSAQSQTAQENWSFNAAVRPEVPPSASLKHGDRVHNPIDAFVLQQLEKSNLSPAPLADKQTLVRRAYIDLIGLPPSPDQVSSFVNNSSKTAWIDLINALLASQHYGERWGRHWLDVARYADSGGFEGDISYPHAWRYRDYVVKAFNDDRPYNVFVQEQIAGDELWPNNLDSILAASTSLPRNNFGIRKPAKVPAFLALGHGSPNPHSMHGGFITKPLPIGSTPPPRSSWALPWAALAATNINLIL